MTELALRPWQLTDEADILSLNAESVSVLSPMDAHRFAELRERSCWLRVAESNGRVVGFLMGFSDGAGYDSPNYRWFDDRLRRFFYIDRVVVSKRHRGLGLGGRFYRQAEQWATEQELTWLAADRLNLAAESRAPLCICRV